MYALFNAAKYMADMMHLAKSVIDPSLPHNKLLYKAFARIGGFKEVVARQLFP